MPVGKLWRTEVHRMRAVGLAVVVVASVLTLGAGAGAAQQTSVVSAESQNVSEGTDATVNVSIDTAPNGLQKYNLTISLSNPGAADIDTARIGDFGPFKIVAQSADSVTVRAVDLNDGAPPDSGPIQLTTLELTNTTEGTTDIEITVNEVLDDDGNTVVPATQAGTLTVTAGDDGQSQANTTVTISLDGAPNGLQLYNLTATTPTSATITEVTPKTITGEQVQLSGGVGESSVTARAADISGTVGNFSENRTLLNITFDDEVQADEVSVTVNELQDDTGDQISQDRIVTEVQIESPPESENPFPNGIPGVGTQAQPTDPDDDGEYEDVDGNGNANFDDAIALAFANFDTISTGSQAQVNAVDFDDDGDADFDDAIELAFSV